MKQPCKHMIMPRRRFGKLGLLVTAVFGTSAVQFNSVAMAETPLPLKGTNMLINALKLIGKEATLAHAQKLEAAQTNRLQTGGAPFSLHLRNAGLDASDADILADALLSLPSQSLAQNGAALGSFSVSYNPLLGDDGTIALANALPQTVTEIGMVGCNMGDVGCAALLKWAKQAPHLKMLCIEDNKLSAEAKQGFRDFGQQRSGLFVVV